MSEVIIIGLDIAKHVFTPTERMSAFSMRISRGKLLDFFAAQPSCTIALEACGGAHHWGRQRAQLGHEVRLITPAYVKPFGAPRRRVLPAEKDPPRELSIDLVADERFGRAIG
ncbi:hypothetical protein [Bradyrhizobium sp. ORS 111]|uniref:hypothetical protein n=1 Tax=Bradyrhizobium sp. ORS 111 TaxID=1685958 RepID=UPI00388E8327